MFKAMPHFILNLIIYSCNSRLFQLSIIFLDMEGSSVQELSAIHMNALTRQIVDVYHAHAKSYNHDSWARLHIHGLNTTFLQQRGFPNEEALINDFKDWMRGKDVLAMYANDPAKESSALNMPIRDMGIPPWAERVYQPYHQIALTHKQEFIPILDKRCCAEAHAAFSKYPMKRLSETEIAKRDYGYHCSLYDAYELYLCYITN